MSSGNLVSVIYAPETVYGVEDSPLSTVTANTVRFTSESLIDNPVEMDSGSPGFLENTKIFAGL